MGGTIAERLGNRKITVDILAVLFGLGSWIGINGIYSQLPQLDTLPEGWNLAANIVVAVQFANLGPILYTLYTKYSPWTRDHYIIYSLIGAATLGIFYLSFNYKNTSYIFGKEHSTSLLTIVLICAFVGCTSSVLFLPYMRNYREIYTVSCLVGEGLSGLLPNLIALVQGASGDPYCHNATMPGDTKQSYVKRSSEPRFSTDIFLLIIGSLLFLSFLAFIALNKSGVARGERLKSQEITETRPTETTAPLSYATNSEWNLSKRNYANFMIMIGITCFFGHSALPSIQTFVCLPYGNNAYHLAVTLAAMATPLSMSTGFIKKKIDTPDFLAVLTGVLVGVSCIIIFIATQSPYPPFQHTKFGTFFIIILWIIVNGLIGYIKMSITMIFRSHPGKGLYHVGIAIQVGSIIGAVLTYQIMDIPGLFVSYDVCEIYRKS